MSSSSSSMYTACLAEVFPSADDAIVSYLSSLLSDASPAPKNVKSLCAVLNDYLVDYELSDNLKDATAACHKLAQAMQKKGLKIEIEKAPQAALTVAAPAPLSASNSKSKITPSPSPLPSPSPPPQPSSSPPSSSPPLVVKPQGGVGSVSSGVVSFVSVHTEERWLVATDIHRHLLLPKMTIQIKSPSDRRWYAGVLVDSLPSGQYSVRFTTSNDSPILTVDLSSIKFKMLVEIEDISLDEDEEWMAWQRAVLAEKESSLSSALAEKDKKTKLLAAPVCIGEIQKQFVKEKKKKTVKIQEMKYNDLLTKSELKKIQKDRQRTDLLKKKEQMRIERAEQMKLNAIRKYLMSDARGKTRDVDIKDIALMTPDASMELLNSANLRLINGRKYGLIGRNGVGKSTLLRAIACYDFTNFPTHLRVVHVEQEVVGDESPVIDYILKSDIERTLLLEQEKKLLSSLDDSEVKRLQNNSKLIAATAPSDSSTSETNDDKDEKNGVAFDEKSSEINFDELEKELEELESIDENGEEADEEFQEQMRKIEEEIKVAEAKQQKQKESEESDAAEERRVEEKEKDKNASKNQAKGKSAKAKKKTTTAKTEAKELDEAEANMNPAARLEKIYQRMREIDVWGAEARARAILQGLQFSKEMQEMKTKDLSGGWRMRVALACALFVQPDVLLLDEPTNHLDFPAVIWLEEYLRRYKSTLVIVSHDRTFLNQVCTDVIHFYRQSLTYYRGNYATFENVRSEHLKAMKRQFEAQKLKRDHVQKFIDRFRCNAKRASLVQSRIKLLSKMEILEDVVADSEVKFSFPEPDRIDGTIVSCTDVFFGYTPDRLLLHDVSVHVDMDSRLGILGANGSGKSTLINLLIGKLEALEGLVHRDDTARIATFAQHHMDQLQPQQSPVELFSSRWPTATVQDVRRHLGSFGIGGPLALQPIMNLSGGQKSRVAFALVTWTKPHVMIMDEPTNHLDMETIDALIGCVQRFGGGVVIVSHDQHFLQCTCNDYLAVSDGRLKRFESLQSAKKWTYGNSV